jgi:plastocyanin
MSAARLSLAAVVAAGACAVLAGPASASSGPSVKMYDDCDPASFNAAIGPGTCVGDGRTQFGDFIGSLIATKDAPEWHFKPEARTINAGQSLDVRNRGGEFHTFTEVDHFGTPGCVGQLNEILFGAPDVGMPVEGTPDCEFDPAIQAPAVFGATGVAPGDRRSFDPLPAGTHLFECFIHPWMEMTVTVRDR